MDRVCIRAIPEIGICEEYRYSADVGLTSLTKPTLLGDGRPSFHGTMKLRIPYYSSTDNLGMNPEAQRDYHRLKKLGKTRSLSAAHIGTLGLAKPRIKTDDKDPLEGLWKELGLRYGMKAIEIPLSEYESRRDALEEYRTECSYHINSTPERLDVTIGAELLNEYDYGRAVFSEAQVLVIAVKVSSHRLFDWGIEYLYLDWPFELGWAVQPFEAEEYARIREKIKYQLALEEGGSFDGNETDIKQWQLMPRHDAESNRLFWTDGTTGVYKVKWRNEKGQGFRIPLRLTEPCRLAEQKVPIHGGLKLVPATIAVNDGGGRNDGPLPLLSGITPTFYSAAGAPLGADHQALKTKSIVRAEFNMDLADVFRRRSYETRRSLVFDGVIPEKGRFLDIRTAMLDSGLDQLAAVALNRQTTVGDEGAHRDSTVMIRDDIEAFNMLRDALEGKPETLDSLKWIDEPQAVNASVWAGYYFKTRLGGSEARVYVVARGEKKVVERELELVGGGKTKATITSGRIDVWFRAFHDDIQAITELMNRLQAIIKERFEVLRVT